jgi:hypothetical protein
MQVAFHLATRCLPKYSCKFSRHDFTRPQLFACLVLREHQRQTYRGAEALLRDAEHWCHDVGMRKVPDHNTLCRAFHALHLGRRANKLLDVLAEWFAVARALGDTVAIDSTLFDTRHRSRHYEQRLRHYATHGDRAAAGGRRSRTAKRTPKLVAAADTRCHAVMGARARTGMGADALEFEPPLVDAWRRYPGRRLKRALGDAGFDSEANHRIARRDLGVRSLIKAGAGRPTAKAPSGHYRRLMRRQLAGSQKGRPYGQRAQAETVMSMMKRNLGDALRARSRLARRHETLLRVITHNVMLARRHLRGSRQSRTYLVYNKTRPRCFLRRSPS